MCIRDRYSSSLTNCVGGNIIVTTRVVELNITEQADAACKENVYWIVVHRSTKNIYMLFVNLISRCNKVYMRSNVWFFIFIVTHCSIDLVDRRFRSCLFTNLAFTSLFLGDIFNKAFLFRCNTCLMSLSLNNKNDGNNNSFTIENIFKTASRIVILHSGNKIHQSMVHTCYFEQTFQPLLWRQSSGWKDSTTETVSPVSHITVENKHLLFSRPCCRSAAEKHTLILRYCPRIEPEASIILLSSAILILVYVAP